MMRSILAGVLLRGLCIGALSLGLAMVDPAPAEAKGPKGGKVKMKGKGKGGGGHHGHHGSCGHKRKKHKGVWVYDVGGVWYMPGLGGWVVVRM